MLPHIFRDYREHGMGVGTSNAQLLDLQEQMEVLKQSLGGDAPIYDKFIAERNNKDRLMLDLKKKEKMILELKSQLKARQRF